MCGIFLVPLCLNFSPLPVFFFFSGRFHLLKRFPIIDLECAFWLCLTAKVFDVCPRLNSHQIPWFRCFSPSTQGPACKVNLPCIIDMKGWWGLLFLVIWWAVKLLDSVCSCWCLYQRVPACVQEKAEICYVWKMGLEKPTPSHGDFHKDNKVVLKRLSLSSSVMVLGFYLNLSIILPAMSHFSHWNTPSSQAQREPPV